MGLYSFIERTLADDGSAGEGGATLTPSRSAGGNAPGPASAPSGSGAPCAPGAGRSRVPHDEGIGTSGSVVQGSDGWC